MTGRNECVIVAALQEVAQAVKNNQHGGNDEFHSLRKFKRNTPPTFKGMYDLEGEHAWLRDIENIFRVMVCPEAQKCNTIHIC